MASSPSALGLRARRHADDLGAPSHAKLARSGPWRCQAARFVLVFSPALLWFPHGAIGIEPVPNAASEWRKTMTTTSDPTTTQLLDGTACPNANRQPKWIAPCGHRRSVGGAGLGVGAVHRGHPTRQTLAPRGCAGVAGAQGPQGVKEDTGPGSPAGPGGPSPPRFHPLATSLKSAPDP